MFSLFCLKELSYFYYKYDWYLSLYLNMYKVQSKIFISTVCKNSETLIAFHVFYIHEKKVKVCCFVREFIFMAVNRRSRGETPFPGVAAPVQVNFKTPTIFSWLSDNSPREHSPISDLIFLPNTQSPFFSPPSPAAPCFMPSRRYYR